MSIAELKALNLHKEKNAKLKRSRACISEINKRHKKIKEKGERIFIGKLLDFRNAAIFTTVNVITLLLNLK